VAYPNACQRSKTIAFTFAEVFDVGFGFLNRAVPIFANLSGISARRRLCIYDQAFFVRGPDDPPISDG